jgi:hypothetical protein
MKEPDLIEQTEYCRYYSVTIEEFLPEFMRKPNRMFIYRCPFGYNIDFVLEDLATLLDIKEIPFTAARKLEPLTPDVA